MIEIVLNSKSNCIEEYYEGIERWNEYKISTHYEKWTETWHTVWENKISKIERCKNRNGIEFKIRRAVSFPLRVISKIDKIGLKKTARFAANKIRKRG